MLSNVLDILKDKLNHYFESTFETVPGTTSDKVTYIDGDKMDPLNFNNNSITPFLINIEEEKVLRKADQYYQTVDGKPQKVKPPIRLNLYLLFVSKFSKYEDTLKHLSHVIKFFQANRVFTKTNTPELSDGIEKIVLELITLPFSEQNEVWSSLRVTYHPSVLYKITMVAYHQEDAAEIQAVEALERKIIRKN